MFLIDDQELKSQVFGVPTFVSSGLRESVTHRILPGATLTVEVSRNPDDLLPSFLALLSQI
jgi:hypothetical protein